MKALVTGGAGFIGSHLTERLLELGHEVAVLDDLSGGSPGNLADAGVRAGLTLCRGSVTDPDQVDPLVASSDIVFHLAARVGVQHYVENPLDVILTNVHGTEAVLAAAARHRVKVVFASTSEVYGKSTSVPFVEDGDRVLGSTTRDRWCYSTSKALDEHLCIAHHRAGLPVVIVRYFNAYGPRALTTAYGGVVTRFVGQALAGQPITVHGDGAQTRTFTYVSDIVEGTVQAALHHNAVGQVFNIGSEDETTILDLANAVRELAGTSSSIVHVPHARAYGPHYEDVPRRVPSIGKARRLLGYEPAVSLREGLRRTIAWQRRAGGQAG